MNEPSQEHSTLSSYVIGFASSIILTLTAYFLVVDQAYAGATLRVFIVALALAQFMTQVVFFLHLGRETKPRWKLLVFTGMVTVVLILVSGSLWIMSNLNYRMSPTQVQNYMQSQDGF
jgi:cytochrome o ubiquinol oxidase subunit IV